MLPPIENDEYDWSVIGDNPNSFKNLISSHHMIPGSTVTVLDDSSKSIILFKYFISIKYPFSIIVCPPIVWDLPRIDIFLLLILASLITLIISSQSLT